MSTFEPLEVRIRLLSAMHAPDSPIHLDALLAAAAVAEADNDYSAQERLPLERYTAADGRWCWKASRLALRVTHRSNVPATRKPDPLAYAEDVQRGRIVGNRLANSITLGTGPYKAYVLSYPSLTVPEARAWCVGDRERITELLASLTHLGKLRRLGFGRIGSIEIAEDAEPERQRWNIRTLPDVAPNRHVAQDNLRAPYWDRTKRELVYEPAMRELVRAAGW